MKFPQLTIGGGARPAGKGKNEVACKGEALADAGCLPGPGVIVSHLKYSYIREERRK